MKVRLQEFTIHEVALRTRIPFKYGIATMTEAPQAIVRALVEVDGNTHWGVSADVLPPQWFTKVPGCDPRAEVDELRAVIRQAVVLAQSQPATEFFEFWQTLYAEQMAAGQRNSWPALLAGFGFSMVERAIISAVCRGLGAPFHAALRRNLFGLHLGAIHPELAGAQPSSFLPAQPLDRVMARHTVGLGDYLSEGEIPENDRLHDGLPQSLEACIRHYGLKHFKLKIMGQLDRDAERLADVARILAAGTSGDYCLTLDGNERFQSVAEWRAFWDGLRLTPILAQLWPRLWFIEQPLHRGAALHPDTATALAQWPERPPMIIDEADGALDSVRVALGLGYDGASHKNCKGVFKGVANYCLMRHREGLQPGRRLIMSGEDLCNVGPIALQEDLAVMGALGITSVERNGHHFCPGLSMFSKRIQDEALRHHADLYQTSLSGWPTVAINDGEIALETVNSASFGPGFEVLAQDFG